MGNFKNQPEMHKNERSFATQGILKVFEWTKFENVFIINVLTVDPKLDLIPIDALITRLISVACDPVD